VTIFKTPSERGLDFRVPQLAVMVHGELVLFDDPEVLDYPWDLPTAHAAPDDDLLRQLQPLPTRMPTRRTGITTGVSAKRISGTITIRGSGISIRRRNTCARASWKSGRHGGGSSFG
jgi:hypothetical protein